MIKLIALILLTLQLTACAGLLAPVGDFFDSQDQCQTKSRPKNAPLPDYCGASAGRSIWIQPTNNHYIVTVK
jgi:hypothetical protein